MPLAIETKSSIISTTQRHATDTGSSEVQIAIMTQRIRDLTEHMRAHKQDFHSRRGLRMLVERRRRLLAYLKRTNVVRYRSLIAELGLRR